MVAEQFYQHFSESGIIDCLLEWFGTSLLTENKEISESHSDTNTNNLQSETEENGSSANSSNNAQTLNDEISKPSRLILNKLIVMDMLALISYVSPHDSRNAQILTLLFENSLEMPKDNASLFAKAIVQVSGTVHSYLMRHD